MKRKEIMDPWIEQCVRGKSGDHFITERCCRIRRDLQNALTLESVSPKNKLERAEGLTATVRDCLEERLQRESGWQRALLGDLIGRLNTVLGLIGAVEDPPTGIHRNYIEAAGRMVADIQDKFSKPEEG